MRLYARPQCSRICVESSVEKKDLLVCVWCVWIAEERQACIFNERVRMDFQEVEWKLRARLQHAQSVRRERAVLEKLRTEKDNLRLLASESRRAGPMVQQQQQGVCRSVVMAWSGGMDVSSGGIRQVAPHAVSSLQQQHQRWGHIRGDALLQLRQSHPSVSDAADSQHEAASFVPLSSSLD